MTTQEVMLELEGYGNAATKNIFFKHGAREPLFGVKVQDLKKIQKKVKKDHDLALSLYATGNSDAMYLAGLIANENKMTQADLQRWVDEAYWYMISEYTVPWVAAESRFGWELGLQWVDSADEHVAAAGWSTLASWANLNADEDLNVKVYRDLLDRVEKSIHSEQNRVRYTMNGFVITVGGAITSLTDKAQKVASSIGKVNVNVGDTACKVPSASDYIQKIIDKGRLGKKKKTVRC
jgi:3-methyladenine DNA glycosylase AlkD